MTRVSIILPLASLFVALSGYAGGAGPSPYAGEETRPVKSLSPDDIAELRRGGGWGLAKAAELNGLPGPLHLLELKDRIPLTPEQVEAVAGIYERMREAAIAQGERFVAAEQALEEAFRADEVTQESLEAMLAEIAESRANLRFIHLSAHLGTPGLLTEAQLARYAALRGYHAHRGSAAHRAHGQDEH
ncbi:MAG: hypothetical protein OXC01_16560 [Immundisolibacterales bacterium]|nr:hypothetical protein [Immundisolibacterales bacterium]